MRENLKDITQLKSSVLEKNIFMDKMLFLRTVDTSWTQRDLRILSSEYTITDRHVKNKKTSIYTANPLFLKNYDKIFCWFGSLNFLPILLIAKLMRKEIIIISGGFDVAKVPTINYGGFARTPFSKLCRKLIFKLADKVISVSKTNYNETIKNASVCEDKLSMIYHGFEDVHGDIVPFNQRKNQVISAGSINPETMNRKGHIHFIELARSLPEVSFILAGRYATECKTHIESLNIKNLTMVGFLTDEELIKLFNESKFYVQLSMHEAFGCSVVEAGLRGCNIITSDSSALPEITKNISTNFKCTDIDLIKNYILSNLEKPKYSPQEISTELISRYPLNKRKNSLLRIVRD
jgi:glycosyltransferase involved in cell wall biosynthesis